MLLKGEHSLQCRALTNAMTLLVTFLWCRGNCSISDCLMPLTMLGMHTCIQGPSFFDLFSNYNRRRTSLRMLKNAYNASDVMLLGVLSKLGLQYVSICWLEVWMLCREEEAENCSGLRYRNAEASTSAREPCSAPQRSTLKCSGWEHDWCIYSFKIKCGCSGLQYCCCVFLSNYFRPDAKWTEVSLKHWFSLCIP